jgi:hypothetical protein
MTDLMLVTELTTARTRLRDVRQREARLEHRLVEGDGEVWPDLNAIRDEKDQLAREVAVLERRQRDDARADVLREAAELVPLTEVIDTRKGQLEAAQCAARAAPSRDTVTAIELAYRTLHGLLHDVYAVTRDSVHKPAWDAACGIPHDLMIYVRPDFRSPNRKPVIDRSAWAGLIAALRDRLVDLDPGNGDAA